MKAAQVFTVRPTELFNENQHRCLLFSDLVEGEGVQSNQFLIADGDDFALIDPGGDLTYNALTIELARDYDLKALRYIFASHQDPDIISSLDKWLLHTQCSVITPRLWARFLPHLASEYVNKTLAGAVFDRIIAVPDEGMRVPFGATEIICLPAHFLHSVGNIQFYDPVSKILFSGDIGASMGADGELEVSDFEQHIQNMAGFHRRYMGSQKITRLWVEMVRQLDVEMIVPQHGKYFKGKTMIKAFLDWVSQLKCGIDLMSAANFRIPR
ncbi:metallo-beta-lactamase superfamily protein [Oleiphilus messinensis]|uniref:Metallo-beta-lactamase superfamily protein n=1 Tax=Oleiphilus messinensis TaxID=141451 RepID=A0A1Y0IGK7_9GAMM|nr:MBL fold metallo-hydrolase [Oleiphilus messinensis]ARU59608.1 metallo-beta-lactamase superfamily protein [Oleiphilus messinensis]